MSEPVSVVVVSRGRPAALCRCLTALGQLYHPTFEVVVVADPAGQAAVAAAGFGARIKQVVYDTANISAARNLGVAEASGGIVAFIDDDAVPEPTWLDALTTPLADPTVAAAGGFVRGRNGFSLQWGARTVDVDGGTRPLAVPLDRASLHEASPGQGIKTEGTNMALRRADLARLGGFDPAYRFYLDETDLNLRLAALGAVTAIVPGAIVHHGFLESERRRSDRVPLDLTQIGASEAVFLRRHNPGADPRHRQAQRRAEQERRLVSHLIAGRVEPRDLRRLLASHAAGWAEGLARPLSALEPIGPSGAAFVPFGCDTPRGHVTRAGRVWQRGLMAEAAKLVAGGTRVSLCLISPTARRHRVAFTDSGVWLQTGGLFGRSIGGDPRVRGWSFRARVEREFTAMTQYRSKLGDSVTK